MPQVVASVPLRENIVKIFMDKKNLKEREFLTEY